jgi:hypothetical protein
MAIYDSMSSVISQGAPWPAFEGMKDFSRLMKQE